MTITETDVRSQTSHGGTGSALVAHIVAKRGLTEAYIVGAEVEALCGVRWVPTWDPKNYPVCEVCKAIWDAAIGGSLPTG